MGSSLNLRESPSFPDFLQTPHENDAYPPYYRIDHDTGSYRPARHWVLLAEIAEDRTFRLPGGITVMGRRPGNLGIERPRYLVRDRSNNEFLVAFHVDEQEMRGAFDEEKFVIGHTLAVFYADQHFFADGTVGLRIETLKHLKIIPCSLQTLLDADPAAVTKAASCTRCGRDDSKLLVCSKCKTKYCSQTCQHEDWPAHKPQCVALRQVKVWESRQWSDFTGMWSVF